MHVQCVKTYVHHGHVSHTCKVELPYCNVHVLYQLVVVCKKVWAVNLNPRLMAMMTL